MRFTDFHRKPISVFVMLVFTALLCFWANPSPAVTASPAPDKSTTAAAASGEENGPGFIEEEASAPVAKKGKKIPWLVIGAVVVVGAAALYFLVLKKTKYELTVTLGEGCTGTPSVNAKFKKGEIVAYSYSAQNGYGNLQVKLDGVAVAATGTVTMDKAHSLDISATYGAAVTITSTPGGAKVYDNNVDSGKTTPASFSYSAAGSHTYLLRQCGYQDFTLTQAVVVGQTYNLTAAMTPGILDNFVAPVTCWTPSSASEWTVASGVYKGSTTTKEKWNFSYYNTAAGSSTYTAEVKMKKVQGTETSVAVLLTTSTNLTAVNGYLFNYSTNGTYSIWKETNSDWIADTGTSVALKGWTSSARINQNLNVWNTLKIVRSGNNYSFYINGFLLASFSDASFDVRTLVLTCFSGQATVTEMHYDFVKLTIGLATVLPPIETVSVAAAAGKHTGPN